MKSKNIVGVLSIGAILGGLVSAGIPVDAKADIEAYVVKVDENIYSYNKYELTEDFLNFKAGNSAELYKDFTVKLKIGNGFHAFKDGKKGFINYKDIEKNYLDAKTEHKTFSVDKYVESKECKVIEVTWTKKAVITKDGQIKYETSVKNDLENKNKDTENKENNKDNDNKESDNENDNNNKTTDSKDVVSSDDKTSGNNTSSNNKHKHKHKSSSGVKENKEEKKSDVVQKDDKKDQEDKQKQEQLKKEQEAKAKAEKEKQEQQAKEREKQAKIEAEKKKTEQQKKAAEVKAKEEKVKHENQAKEEAEKIEREKKAEAEKQKAKELKKQEELRKQKEVEAKAKEEQLKKEKEEKAKKEQAEKERQAKKEAEKKKAEQQQREAEAKAKAEKEKEEQKAREEAERQKAEQLKKEQEEKVKQEQLKKEENNRLIEETKNNINLGDLTNVKNNLALPTKDTNGVQIAWKSSDESVIKNNGTVTRPSADKGDKKVTLIATFTKDSLTSTKDFEAIVKAQDKILVKTEEEEIAELLKADKKIEINQPEKFDKVIKEAVRQLKPSFTVMVPYAEYKKFNFNNFNNIMVELGGNDYGKPGISTSGGSVQVIDDKIPMTVQLNYRRDINEVKRQKDATEDAIKRIITEVIKPGMTDVEKELALHDYVVKQADYNMEGLNKNPVDLEDHSAYGVLVLGKGVCESYAKAMHLLLNEVGIECKYATGNKVNQNGSIGGGHAWNMVKLDNEWYNLDATWDDPVSDRVGKSDKEVIVSPVIHTYFNVTDTVFNKDHKRGKYEEANYPVANGTKYAYDKLDVDEFMNDGTKVPSVTSKEELIQKVKETMKNKKTTLYVRLKGFKITQQELMNELGKVLDGNIYKSYGVSPTDESHAYCNFVLR